MLEPWFPVGVGIRGSCRGVDVFLGGIDPIKCSKEGCVKLGIFKKALKRKCNFSFINTTRKHL